MTDRRMRQLERLADEVRRCYVERRTRMFPAYRMKREYAGHTIWVRAAEYLLANQASPQQLIDAAFRGIRPFPNPTQILSQKAMEAMESKPGPSMAVVKFNYNMTFYRQIRGKPSLPDTILSDDWHPFSPLFRFVMARAEGLEALASKYLQAAATYLQQNPDLRTLIPEDSLRILEEEACL